MAICQGCFDWEFLHGRGLDWMALVVSSNSMIFGGDPSVETVRRSAGNGLIFDDQEETASKMPPETKASQQYIPDDSSEEMFSQEALQGTSYVLNLEEVADDEDMTQVTIENATNEHAGENGGTQPSSEDEHDQQQGPSFEPVKPSACQLQSLTPAVRLALICRKYERSSVDKMADKLILNFSSHLGQLERFEREMQLKEKFLEETRSDFRELLSVFRQFTEFCMENSQKNNKSTGGF